MTHTFQLWMVALCLSTCVQFGAAGPALAEGAAVTPSRSKDTDPAVEPLSKNGDAQSSNEDAIRFAQNTVGRQNFRLESSGDKNWEFTVAPYLWAVSLDGDATVGGVSSDVDVDFKDIFDHAEFGINLHLEAQRGRWGAFLDPMYVKLEADARAGTTSVNVENEFFMIEFGGFFRAFDRDLGSSGRFHLAMEPLIGGRWWSMSTDIDFSGPSAPADVSGSEDWIDLIVGSRITLSLSPKWSVRLRNDIGGFGLGSSSDLSQHHVLVFGYEMTEYATLIFGFRHLDVDYNDGSGTTRFEYDVGHSGPVIGTAFRF